METEIDNQINDFVHIEKDNPHIYAKLKLLNDIEIPYLVELIGTVRKYLVSHKESRDYCSGNRVINSDHPECNVDTIVMVSVITSSLNMKKEFDIIPNAKDIPVGIYENILNRLFRIITLTNNSGRREEYNSGEDYINCLELGKVVSLIRQIDNNKYYWCSSLILLNYICGYILHENLVYGKDAVNFATIKNRKNIEKLLRTIDEYYNGECFNENSYRTIAINILSETDFHRYVSSMINNDDTVYYKSLSSNKNYEIVWKSLPQCREEGIDYTVCKNKLLLESVSKNFINMMYESA
jgi:hypothetical protein